ncbi:MAG: PTS sugar transporter subunit IIA [Deltaproteobacteria bacterium]|jgi:nitrogen PTS system EIIA component|nr:PTS sugar transporter subunit IIA [Deltaproteobacteria bacterium]MBT4524948.1 PTS sugar transporter subunit IIA [Deltaproteobacteria bacterium]
MNLSDYLNGSRIVLNLQGENKKQVLEKLVEILGNQISINQQNIVDLLEVREKLSTTGIGFGIAIPHCKSSEVSELQIVVGRFEQGVDFDALDDNPVKLLFLLVAPEQSSSEHLKVLAKIARIAKDAEIREQILQITDSNAVFDYIKERESKFD